jgi:hypothetical protein
MRVGPEPLLCTDKEAQYILITKPAECTDNETPPCTDNETPPSTDNETPPCTDNGAPRYSYVVIGTYR